jgi:uncharacterized protein YjdB
VSNGVIAGTTGRSLRVEALKLNLIGELPTGASIIYQTHIQNTGWQKAVSDGDISGTTGKGLRIEAVKITLSGLSGYTVKYRVHVENYGWMDWQSTKNGTDIENAMIAGTTGQGLRIEAVEIIIEKS